MAVPAFAAVEQLVNTGCHAVLSNALLAYDNAGTPTEVLCILADRRNEPDAIGAPRAVRSITAEVIEGDLGGLKAGVAVTINSVVYQVSRLERDKTGWVTLHLRGGVAP